MDSLVWAAVVGAVPPTLMAFLTWRRQKPTSNGFAETVKTDLTAIKTLLQAHIDDKRAHMPDATTAVISGVLRGAADSIEAQLPPRPEAREGLPTAAVK